MQTTAPRRGSRHGLTSRDGPPAASTAVTGPSGPAGARPMTVAAMRAAVVAIRAGVFDDVPGGDAIGGGHPDRTRLLWATPDIGGPVVLVLAGHAGAGASTVALAIADGVAADRRVQLVDYADPSRSGLVAAATIELGKDGTGWRRGRRGRLDLCRLTQCPAGGQLPPLPATDGAEIPVVVDAGWSLTTALLDFPDSLRGARIVVVSRVTVPGLRQTERVLAAVEDQGQGEGEVAVAAVGPARWPRVVEASCGPRLRAARSQGRLVPVPVDRRLATVGLTGDRLPKPVAAAGRSLAALLVPAGSPQPRHRRRATRPRPAPGAV